MEQPTLAQACSVSLLTNPSFVIKPEMSTRKHITTSLSGFINPLVWWEVRTHDFLEGHWHDPAPSVAYLPYMDLRTKADVNNSMGFLAKWTTMCFERFGSTVVLSHNHKCLKTHLGPIPLGTLTADYLFTSLAPTRGVSHLAVLETRTPGALECFSSTHGPSYDPRKNDKELDKHARAFAFQFDCQLVMFYDGTRLVSIFFTNPVDTSTAPPRFWVVEHDSEIRSDVEVAYRMRYMIMASLCYALDAKVPEWYQQR